MLTLGSAFIRDSHVWFVLSNPAANNGRVLCVNITSLHDNCPDDECILDFSDYCWIERGHKSAVAFSRARIWDSKKVEAAIANGLLKCPSQGDVLITTVNKVIRSALKSRELSKEMKSFL